MIDHTLWVTTDKFEVTTPGPHFINPICFGEDFAQWLQKAFQERGVAISEPTQEDWGWVLIATSDDYNFTISIGVMDESIGKIPAVWRIGVSYEKGMNSFRKWFKAPPVETLEKLFHELQTIVSTEPQFKVTDNEP